MKAEHEWIRRILFESTFAFKLECIYLMLRISFMNLRILKDNSFKPGCKNSANITTKDEMSKRLNVTKDEMVTNRAIENPFVLLMY